MVYINMSYSQLNQNYTNASYQFAPNSVDRCNPCSPCGLFGNINPFAQPCNPLEALYSGNIPCQRGCGVNDGCCGNSCSGNCDVCVSPCSENLNRNYSPWSYLAPLPFTPVCLPCAPICPPPCGPIYQPCGPPCEEIVSISCSDKKKKCCCKSCKKNKCKKDCKKECCTKPLQINPCCATGNNCIEICPCPPPCAVPCPVPVPIPTEPCDPCFRPWLQYWPWNVRSWYGKFTN